MSKIKGTVFETILTGLTALALVFLMYVFAGMTRQSLILLVLFILMAVLAGLVIYLLWKVRFGPERQRSAPPQVETAVLLSGKSSNGPASLSAAAAPPLV